MTVASLPAPRPLAPPWLLVLLAVLLAPALLPWVALAPLPGLRSGEQP